MTTIFFFSSFVGLIDFGLYYIGLLASYLASKFDVRVYVLRVRGT